MIERGLTKDDLELRARQQFRDAAMGAPAIAERLLGATRTVHVEGIGVGEDVLVSVGGLVRDDEAVAGLDELYVARNKQ